jgi:hypothetical protein
MALRFHLDEHVPHAVADALRRRGIDVTATSEAGLLGASDQAHLSFATANQRVIYTEDADFLSLVATQPDHTGIVYSAPGTRTIRQFIEFLVLLDACFSPADMWGHIEFIPPASG